MNKILLTFMSLCMLFSTIAQVGIGTTSPHESAVLELNSSNRGMLIPRMTTYQRNQIVSPVGGLMVYNTERGTLQIFRENIGSGNLSGWYDSQCSGDVEAIFSAFPQGITLDFSNMEEHGRIYSGVNGTGTQYTSSSANDSEIGSIGPIYQNIADTTTGSTYISFVDRSETGTLGSNHNFTLHNSTEVNEYNASTFASRINDFDGSGDLMTANLTNYSGDFDIILVAKFNALPTTDNASFFSTGGTGNGLLLGCGNTSYTNCTRDYFNMNFDSETAICGGAANRVSIDLEFHRFRIKYTDNGASNAIVEFYIDGILVETHQNSNINSAQISRLDLFNNRARSSFSTSSIAYLGVYSAHLSTENFEVLDKYLACKFESQP